METEDKPSPQKQFFLARKLQKRQRETRNLNRAYREAYNDAIRDRDDNEARQLLAEGCVMFQARSPFLDAFQEAEEEAAMEQDSDEFDESF